MLSPGRGSSPGEGIGYPLQYSWTSLVAQLVKNPPAMRETWVQSLGWEDLLEKRKATHSSILDCRIPRTVKRLSLSVLSSAVCRISSLEHSEQDSLCSRKICTASPVKVEKVSFLRTPELLPGSHPAPSPGDLCSWSPIPSKLTGKFLPLPMDLSHPQFSELVQYS